MWLQQQNAQLRVVSPQKGRVFFAQNNQDSALTKTSEIKQAHVSFVKQC